MEKVRDCRPVKSEVNEEAHALSSTQQRKGEQGARKNHDYICTYQEGCGPVDLNHQITTSCPLDVVSCVKAWPYSFPQGKSKARKCPSLDRQLIEEARICWECRSYLTGCCDEPVGRK